MNGDIISIIVPVYNTAPYLDRCIQSIQNQTFENYELILVDDGSMDESGNICDGYARTDTKIVVVHKENTGVSATRNVGIKLLHGKYFMFLDSDDWLENCALQKCYEQIENDKSDVVVFGRLEVFENKIEKIELYGSGIITDKIKVIKEILADRHIYGGGYPNKMWKVKSFQEGLEEIPLFNEELFYVEDMEWVIRMLLRTKRISLLNQPLYNYCIRETSVSQSKEMLEKRLIGYHDAMEAVVNTLSLEPGIQKWFKGISDTELINSILDAYLKKQKKVCSELYKKISGRTNQILKSREISLKVKCRFILLKTGHSFKII